MSGLFHFCFVLKKRDHFSFGFNKFYCSSSRNEVGLQVLTTLVTALLYFSFINSEEPEQTPRSAVSDLGLHCLPMFLLSDIKNE